MKPIYEPKGAAKEYGDLALNIYTGCPHRCFYCFAPSVLRRDREAFHANVRPRDGIIEATRRQLEKEQITGKTIHLCFTCDPYPTGYDTTPTREIIKLLKEYGNHVQILTKGTGSRDFDFEQQIMAFRSAEGLLFVRRASAEPCKITGDTAFTLRMFEDDDGNRFPRVAVYHGMICEALLRPIDKVYADAIVKRLARLGAFPVWTGEGGENDEKVDIAG